MAEKVLVVDDDPTVAELIKLVLKPRGLSIYHAINGQEGLKLAYEIQPDLIILDIMMPEHDGFEVCARLREFSDVPILMLTAKSQTSDITHGFAVGADDFVKKPFSNEELASRIESLLRRNKNNANTNITGYSDDLLEIELASQKIMLEGEEISLTPTEFNLLAYLIRHPQKTLSPRTLLIEVWGDSYSHDKALLSLYIHQLRQKLREEDAEHKYIQTQWGQGYWFNPKPESNQIIPVSSPEVDEESEKKDDFSSNNIQKYVWPWGVITVLLVLLGFVLLQKLIPNMNQFVLNKESTSIEAILTAEGYNENGNVGVLGQVCIANSGKNPTQNLVILNTIQLLSDKTETLLSSNVDVSNKPALQPGESYCYPYKILFDPVSRKDTQYHTMASITISNYTDLMPGSEHCPGSKPCMFGPSLTADFIVPEP